MHSQHKHTYIHTHTAHNTHNQFLYLTRLSLSPTVGTPAAAAAAASPPPTSREVLLTDPAVHCVQSERFGPTNLKMGGVKGFFSTHACNEYCKALKLPPFA